MFFQFNLFNFVIISLTIYHSLICFALREDYGHSTYCRPCISPCEYYEKDKYYWCKTEHWVFNGQVFTWDYCSLNATVDYHSKQCTSECAFHGEQYQWCATSKDWGYCSGPFCTDQTLELPDYGYSTYCQRCITPCDLYEGGKNYWCGTRKWQWDNKTWTWDYCSPSYGVDFQGKNCLNGCKFRGKDYQNCRSSEKVSNASGKGYCSGKGKTLCDFVQPFQ